MAIKFLSGVNIDSNTLFVDDANNRVGIGTGAPTAKLQLYGSGLVEANVTSTNDQALLYLQGTFGQVANNAGDFYITNSAPSSSLILRTADTERMRITSAGNVGIGTTSTFGRLQISGTVVNPDLSSATATGVSLVISNSDTGYGTMFATYGNGNGALQQRRTNTNTYYDFLLQPHGGNVGIGTSSPVVKLQVDGTITSTGVLTAYTSVPSINIGHNGDSAFIAATSGSGANTPISFSVGNNNEKMRITADGNVGIGTTSPSYKLDISTSQSIRVIGSSNGYTQGSIIFQSSTTDSPGARGLGVYLFNEGNDATWFYGTGYGAGDTFLINRKSGATYQDSAAAPAESSNFFAITNAGNVGIGTTAPTSKLYIEGGSANWNETTPGLSVGTIHLDPGTDTDDYGNAITFGASDAGGGTNAQAGIYLRSDGNYGTKMYFATTDSYAAGSKTRMFIGHDGNVGIGTTSPAFTSGDGLEIQRSSATATLRLDSGVFATELRAYTDGTFLGQLSNAYLDLGTDNSTKVRITGAGNVGIGTTSPAYKLDVSSDIRIGEGLTMSPNAGSLYSVDGALSYYSSTNGVYLNGAGTNGWLRLNASGVENYNNCIDIYGGAAGAYMIFRTNNSERMRITSTGNVGIGTTSPSYKTSIVAANGNYWNGTAFTGTPLALSIENSEPGGYDPVLIYNQADSGGTLKNSGAIGMVGTGPWTAGNNALQVSDMYFLVRNSSGSISERLRIKSTGAAQLKAYGSGSFTGTVAYNLAVDSSGNIIETAGGVVDGSGTANYVSKWSDANTLTDSQLFDNGTNVGIGTASPQSKLHVARAGNTNGGTILMGVGGSGTDKWSFLAGTHYNQATGSGNGSGSAGVALIGANTTETSNAVYIGGGPYEINPATVIVFNTYTATTHNLGGLERMRITSDGNLSVGTTANPGSRTNIYISESGATPNAILRLQNSGSQYLAKMILTDGNTNDAVIGYQGGVTGATQYLGFGLGTAITQMVLNGSGNVGIGTTAPQLVGAAWTTLEVQGQSAGGGGIVYTANNGATVKSHFYTDGTSGFVGTQTNHYFGFTTNNQERGRFTAGGNLLIGTTTDGGYKLRVNGTGRYDDYLQLWSGTAGASPRLIFGGETSSTDKSIFLESYYMVFQGHNNEGFKFQTTSSLGAVSNRMSILGNGTVVLSNYGSGSKTGTVAYNLAVDASGNVIETAGGVVDGSGTANYVTKWQDANTVTNSSITDDGTTVTATAANFVSQSNLGTAYTSFTTSGTTAIFDTITRTDAAIYQMVIVANPNSAGSGSYQDFYYGKVFIGTGYNGSIVAQFINYHQESPMPRGLYGSGGGDLTVTAVMLVSGSEVTEVANGTSYTIRIKIAGYQVAGAGTTVRLQRIM